MLCREPGASSDKDTLLDAQVEDFLFYLGNAALACVRVEVVVDSEPLLEEKNPKVSSDHKQEWAVVGGSALTNIPAAGGVHPTTSRGRKSSHADKMTSRRPVYSVLKFINHLKYPS